MKIEIITTEAQLAHARLLRKEVFVVEQGVPEENEYDEYDDLASAAVHVLATCANDQPIGCGRVRFVNGEGKLERVVVSKEKRASGVGKAIIQKLEAVVREKGYEKAYLHGQTAALGFYEKLGYHAVGDVFFEEGIAHIKCEKHV